MVRLLIKLSLKLVKKAGYALYRRLTRHPDFYYHYPEPQPVPVASDEGESVGYAPQVQLTERAKAMVVEAMSFGVSPEVEDEKPLAGSARARMLERQRARRM